LVGRGLRLALAGPAVPAGRYARDYLTRANVLDALRPHIVDAEHVRAALAMVESGAADCAMVYLSDARAATRATLLWTATASSNPDIAYAGAAFSRSTSPWADAFLEWLSIEDFQAAAESRGFLRPR
jgi:molybdate transport system substrate-binding protein